jgi:nucleolin
VFVGNLSFNIDEESIREAFKSCGEITSVRFAEDKMTGEFKGFGHIEFSKTESTDAAVKMAGTSILGRSVRVDYANDRKGGGDGGSPRKFGGGGRGRGGFGRGSDGGGRGAGRGRGAFGRSGRGGGRGNSTTAKKNGGITEFTGKKITFD